MAEERVKRRLAAILASDVVGYSRLMGDDEAGTLAALKERHAQVIDPGIAANDGRIVKLMGDGTLAEFASVVDAVQCAIEIQRFMAERNAGAPQNRRIELRIGINLGDVILDGDDIYGDGVNVAARLEALAEPGGICISGAVRDAIGNKLSVDFEDMGEQKVKNIEKPVRAYRKVETRREVTARVHTTPQPRSKPSIAVKPFVNLSGDPEQDQFADGLSNGILAALNRIPNLTLIQDESPSLSRSKEMSVQELTRKFDVRYVLKGSLRKLGNRLRVNADLMEVSTGRIAWAEQFDRELGDIAALFDIQDEITEEIVTALDVKLLGGDAIRLVRKAFRDSAALRSYFNGESLLWEAKNKLELREAQRLLEESIHLEPTCSAGYAAAAVAYWVEALSDDSDRTEEALRLAVERAQEAIRLDDVTGYPHLVLAQVHLSKRDYDAASAEADRAVSARPNCPASFTLKASVLNYLGRPSDAVEHAEYALRLTPVHPPMYPAILASAFYGSGRYEEAVAAAKTAIELDEAHIDPFLMLAASNAALGRGEEARLAADRVRTLKPAFTLDDFAASQPYREPDHLNRLLGQLRSAGLD
jgi:adenylate cyclase